MKIEEIYSLQNPQVKNVVLLQEKSKERNRQQLFVVEGAREIMQAQASDFILHTLYACDEILTDSSVLRNFKSQQIQYVSKAVFQKMAYRENVEGLIALFQQQQIKLHDLKLRPQPFIIILEGVEKPGNLGAILRTADAAHVDAVIVCDPKCDLYNPNVVRSSLGCIFSVPVLTASSNEVLAWLNEHKIQSFAAELKASRWYHETDYTPSSAIVMGTEATGLSDFWLDHATARIKIPMLGKADSLNVSVSTAIITFEAMRQRQFTIK